MLMDDQEKSRQGKEGVYPHNVKSKLRLTYSNDPNSIVFSDPPNLFFSHKRM